MRYKVLKIFTSITTRLSPCRGCDKTPSSREQCARRCTRRLLSHSCTVWTWAESWSRPGRPPWRSQTHPQHTASVSYPSGRPPLDWTLVSPPCSDRTLQVTGSVNNTCAQGTTTYYTSLFTICEIIKDRIENNSIQWYHTEPIEHSEIITQEVSIITQEI